MDTGDKQIACVHHSRPSVSNPVIQSIFRLFVIVFILVTRMHSSRMHTACSVIISPYLIISHACPPRHTCLPSSCMPPTMHTPQQPCLPPATMPAPSNHAHPPQQPCMSPGNHARPPTTMHAPWQPCMPPSNHTPPSNHACPPFCGQTHTCKNITFANFVCGR